MTSTNNNDDILSELADIIKDGERLNTGDKNISSTTPASSQQAVVIDEQATKKFDKMWVMFVLITIGIFIVFRFLLKSYFTKLDEFGEETFSMKKYIGTSAIVSIIINIGVWWVWGKNPSSPSSSKV